MSGLSALSEIAHILKDPFSEFEDLTERERRLLRWQSRGYTLKEIAERENLNRKSVSVWLSEAHSKTHMDKTKSIQYTFNRIEKVVMQALEEGRPPLK